MHTATQWLVQEQCGWTELAQHQGTGVQDYDRATAGGAMQRNAGAVRNESTYGPYGAIRRTAVQDEGRG